MDYLDALPEEVMSALDGALILDDGSCLPFHTAALCSISPVLAGLLNTQPSKQSKYSIEVPCDKSLNVACALLKWLYHQKNEWTEPIAQNLADLGHLWNIPAVVSECDAWLADRERKRCKSEMELDYKGDCWGIEELLGLVELAVRCNLNEVKPFYVAALLGRAKDVYKLDAFWNSSPRVHSAVLTPLMILLGESLPNACKRCGKKGLLLQCTARKDVDPEEDRFWEEGDEMYWEHSLTIHSFCIICNKKESLGRTFDFHERLSKILR